MTTTTSTRISKVMVPGTVREPRGADWAAGLASLCRDGLVSIFGLVRMELAAAKPLGLAVWRHLEAMGQARARRDLLDLAERRRIDNPGFAEDLRAAALWRSGSDETSPADQAPRRVPKL